MLHLRSKIIVEAECLQFGVTMSSFLPLIYANTGGSNGIFLTFLSFIYKHGKNILLILSQFDIEHYQLILNMVMSVCQLVCMISVYENKYKNFYYITLGIDSFYFLIKLNLPTFSKKGSCKKVNGFLPRLNLT